MFWCGDKGVVVFKCSYVSRVLSAHLEELQEMSRVVFTVPVRYLLVCSYSAFFMFLANPFWKDLKAGQFFCVLCNHTRL